MANTTGASMTPAMPPSASHGTIPVYMMCPICTPHAPSVQNSDSSLKVRHEGLQACSVAHEGLSVQILEGCMDSKAHLHEPHALHEAAEAARRAGQHAVPPHHLQQDADSAGPHGQRQQPVHALVQRGVLLVCAHQEGLYPKGQRQECLR